MRAGAVLIRPEAARPATQSKPMRRMDAIIALAYMLRRNTRAPQCSTRSTLD